ncbi:hypothetical protein C449_12720, partial [Halococcus saccharolyticus DSM 5350]
MIVERGVWMADIGGFGDGWTGERRLPFVSEWTTDIRTGFDGGVAVRGHDRADFASNRVRDPLKAVLDDGSSVEACDLVERVDDSEDLGGIALIVD